MKQEIYVKEMPDFCDECHFHNEENDKCILLPQYAIRPFLQSCPLKSLHDHDKEIVKKVLDSIKIKLGSIEDSLINLGNGKEDALNYFIYILQQTQKEFEYE